ncbi:hypothetical protein JL720_15077 [Aureococcus anophagefferens]|nr:hypothetical protein JL720_15077 [Aureococcus anophagefferens]
MDPPPSGLVRAVKVVLKSLASLPEASAPTAPALRARPVRGRRVPRPDGARPRPGRGAEPPPETDGAAPDVAARPVAGGVAHGDAALLATVDAAGLGEVRAPSRRRGALNPSGGAEAARATLAKQGVKTESADVAVARAALAAAPRCFGGAAQIFAPRRQRRQRPRRYRDGEARGAVTGEFGGDAEHALATLNPRGGALGAAEALHRRRLARGAAGVVQRSPRACLGGVFFDPSDAARVFRGVERGPEPDAAAEADGAKARRRGHSGDAARRARSRDAAARGRVVAGAAALLAGGGASARTATTGSSGPRGDRSEVARGAGAARPGRSSRPGTAASRQGHAKHDDGPPSRGELRVWVDALDGDFRRWRGGVGVVGGGAALACRDADVAAFLAPGLRADLHRLSAGGENVGKARSARPGAGSRARGSGETVDAADDAPAPLFLDGGEAAFARPSRRRGRPRAAAFVAAAAAARRARGAALPAPRRPTASAGDVVVAVDGAAVPDAETCASLLDGKASAALTLRRVVDDGDGDDDAAARARALRVARGGAAALERVAGAFGVAERALDARALAVLHRAAGARAAPAAAAAAEALVAGLARLKRRIYEKTLRARSYVTRDRQHAAAHALRGGGVLPAADGDHGGLVEAQLDVVAPCALAADAKAAPATFAAAVVSRAADLANRAGAAPDEPSFGGVAEAVDGAAPGPLADAVAVAAAPADAVAAPAVLVALAAGRGADAWGGGTLRYGAGALRSAKLAEDAVHDLEAPRRLAAALRALLGLPRVLRAAAPPAAVAAHAAALVDGVEALAASSQAVHFAGAARYLVARLRAARPRAGDVEPWAPTSLVVAAAAAAVAARLEDADLANGRQPNVSTKVAASRSRPSLAATRDVDDYLRALRRASEVNAHVGDPDMPTHFAVLRWGRPDDAGSPRSARRAGVSDRGLDGERRVQASAEIAALRRRAQQLEALLAAAPKDAPPPPRNGAADGAAEPVAEPYGGAATAPATSTAALNMFGHGLTEFSLSLSLRVAEPGDPCGELPMDSGHFHSGGCGLASGVRGFLRDRDAWWHGRRTAGPLGPASRSSRRGNTDEDRLRRSSTRDGQGLALYVHVDGARRAGSFTVSGGRTGDSALNNAVTKAGGSPGYKGSAPPHPLADAPLEVKLGERFRGCLRDVALHAAALEPSAVARGAKALALAAPRRPVRKAPIPLYFYSHSDAASRDMRDKFVASIRDAASDVVLREWVIGASKEDQTQRFGTKIELVLRAIRENPRDSVVIVSDMDLRFYKPMAPVIDAYIGVGDPYDVDIVFQRDEDRSLQGNLGFMALKCNKAVAGVFRTTGEIMQQNRPGRRATRESSTELWRTPGSTACRG